MKNILVIGGARSGKSDFVLELALRLDKPALFVATAEAGDEEMQQRIEKHRKARPADWDTLEATMHVGNRILQKAGEVQVVIVDCITLLVSNIIGQRSDKAGEQIDTSLVEEDVTNEIDELIECSKHINASFIIVTNEVGTGLVPANKIGRLYRDVLGRANQLLAQWADEVYVMVAGLPVKIKPVTPLA